MKELLEAKENAKKEAKKKAEEAKAPKKVVKIIAAEKKDWKIGDKCLAFWWEDKNFYEASIRQVSKKNGSFCCTFTEYGNSVVLRPEQIIPVGTKVTKELRTSAYYLYQEDQKKKKALAVEKAAKKNVGKGKAANEQEANKGLTKEQRMARDAERMREKQAKKAADAAGGSGGGKK